MFRIVAMKASVTWLEVQQALAASAFQEAAQMLQWALQVRSSVSDLQH
jgi:hypothetical protein